MKEKLLKLLEIETQETEEIGSHTKLWFIAELAEGRGVIISNNIAEMRRIISVTYGDALNNISIINLRIGRQNGGTKGGCKYVLPKHEKLLSFLGTYKKLENDRPSLQYNPAMHELCIVSDYGYFIQSVIIVPKHRTTFTA